MMFKNIKKVSLISLGIPLILFVILVLLLFIGTVALDNKKRIAISEWRVSEILQKGTSKENIQLFLSRKKINYNDGIVNLCSFGKQEPIYKNRYIRHGGDLSCDKVDYINIRFPIIFSLISGGVHITFYFDSKENLVNHFSQARYTFI